MVRYVVGPVARAAASASHFTIAGASDLYAINDAVAGFAELAADTHLDVTIATAPHRLTLDAGPIIAWFTGDGADAASRSSGDDGELEDRREALAGLVHRLSVEPCDGGKLLRLQLLDRGRAPVAGA